LKRYGQAQKQFRRGQWKARSVGFDYDFALNLYGEAVVLISRHKPVLALEKAREALSYFYGESTDDANDPFLIRSANMTSVCLYVIALAFQQMREIEKAREYAQRALRWHESGEVDNPTQYNHIVSFVIQCNSKHPHWENFLVTRH